MSFHASLTEQQRMTLTARINTGRSSGLGPKAWRKYFFFLPGDCSYLRKTDPTLAGGGFLPVLATFVVTRRLSLQWPDAMMALTAARPRRSFTAFPFHHPFARAAPVSHNLPRFYRNARGKCFFNSWSVVRSPWFVVRLRPQGWQKVVGSKVPRRPRNASPNKIDPEGVALSFVVD